MVVASQMFFCFVWECLIMSRWEALWNCTNSCRGGNSSTVVNCLVVALWAVELWVSVYEEFTLRVEDYFIQPALVFGESVSCGSIVEPFWYGMIRLDETCWLLLLPATPFSPLARIALVKNLPCSAQHGKPFWMEVEAKGVMLWIWHFYIRFLCDAADHHCIISVFS